MSKDIISKHARSDDETCYVARVDSDLQVHFLNQGIFRFLLLCFNHSNHLGSQDNDIFGLISSVKFRSIMLIYYTFVTHGDVSLADSVHLVDIVLGAKSVKLAKDT